MMEALELVQELTKFETKKSKHLIYIILFVKIISTIPLVRQLIIIHNFFRRVPTTIKSTGNFPSSQKVSLFQRRSEGSNPM